MKSKDGQYIVMCMHAEITVLQRSITKKQFTDELNMAFPWLNVWPL